jgi:aspartate carbamoyltransferase catalytic subunit
VRHILSIDEITNADIGEILDHARRLKQTGATGEELRGKVVGLLFFEPSTRTQMSFSSATQRLGAGVIGFSDPSVSSVAKGETLEDTIRVVQTYAHLLVLRHPEAGAAHRAAAVATVPIINGGDGDREHPTQTLYDLFTIRERLGRLDSVKIGFYGDIRYGRAAKSLAQAMARYGADITWIAPPQLQPDPEFDRRVRGAGAVRTGVAALADAIGELDVFYVSRPQRERWGSMPGVTLPSITSELLGETKKDLVIMHPLPRTDELSTTLDSDPRAAYFQQAANGIPVRMAILHRLLTS